MNPKILHNLIWLPLCILGLAALILGIIILAGNSVDAIIRGGLFSLAGLVLCAVTLKTMMGTARVRRIILATIALFFIGFLLIPNQVGRAIAPPWFFYAAATLSLISLWASLRLRRHDSCGR